MEKTGFVYIWYDRKHKRYYIGCHWGTEDDGYICSSSWMISSYKKRPQDFKRRIIQRDIVKTQLQDAEYYWISMIKPSELKTRYYNLHNHKFDHWSRQEKTNLSIKEKISIKTKEAMTRPEVREKMIPVWETTKGKKQSEETVTKRARSNTGKKRNQETKNKIGAAQKGNKHWLGKKHNVETIQKLTGTNNQFYGKTHTEDVKIKLSSANKGIINWTNGLINKRSFTCPGDGFYKGRIRKST